MSDKAEYVICTELKHLEELFGEPVVAFVGEKVADDEWSLIVLPKADVAIAKKWWKGDQSTPYRQLPVAWTTKTPEYLQIEEAKGILGL